MADSQKTSSSEIFDTIVNGDKAQKAVEEAIDKSLQNFIETADGEIQKLVQNNTLGPDVADEMLKLHKSVIDMTINTIKSGPLGKGSDKK